MNAPRPRRAVFGATKRLAGAATCALLCSACAELSTIMARAAYYSDAPERELVMPDGRYRIRDKPGEGSLMISWTTGTAWRESKLFGTQEDRAPSARFERAAGQHLRDTGRDCAIHRGVILGVPHWEFVYSCRRQPPRP